jgi:hypothetical protein
MIAAPAAARFMITVLVNLCSLTEQEVTKTVIMVPRLGSAYSEHPALHTRGRLRQIAQVLASIPVSQM